MNTLEDWLVRNANNTHSQVYLRWNVRRPTEETRKVIKGILGSLADMHHFGRYHGVLYNSANYILKWAQKHNISRDERYVVKFRQDPNAMYKTTTCAQGQQVDTQCVLMIIFGRILPDSITDYPYVVQNLHDCLKSEPIRIT